ncbi:putative 1-acylglycerol-3-phosphate O-acyltransferase [Porphyridium purpureum]|uniref:Putative 1-acylglycerol-3-phosphate O-acyltransferase n=1 Tax=Porphyridium purpureum TaxID=35688 RepID=A0A5J4Z506_PORPP|nr:putative 1-acylglycerol-3-phosphate O-acyltransferase [Porphyridium purpureum]|eukprot:POR8243..scf295_1
MLRGPIAGSRRSSSIGVWEIPGRKGSDRAIGRAGRLSGLYAGAMGIVESEPSRKHRDVDASAHWLRAIDDTEREMFGLVGLATALEKRRIVVDEDTGEFLNVVSFGKIRSDSPIPLVLFHGWGASLGYYWKNVPGLCESFRVHLVDWRGMGGSSRPPYDLGMCARDAEQWFIAPLRTLLTELRRIDALGPAAKFSIVAHSLGGFLMSLYALERPQDILNLVLVSPVGIPRVPPQKVPSHFPWSKWFVFHFVFTLWGLNLTPMRVLRWSAFLANVFPRAIARNIILPRFPDEPSYVQRACVEYFEAVARAPGSGEYAINTVLEPGGYARAPLCDRLEPLQVPVDFIYGETDWMDFTHGERLCRDVLKNVSEPPRVFRIPDAGHNVHSANPAAFNKLVIDLCTEHAQR